MESLVNQINQANEAIKPELEKAAKGNKSAAKRARKLSLELGKLYKEFRKESTKI